jgi:hypothetical protein
MSYLKRIAIQSQSNFRPQRGIAFTPAPAFASGLHVPAFPTEDAGTESTAAPAPDASAAERTQGEPGDNPIRESSSSAPHRDAPINLAQHNLDSSREIEFEKPDGKPLHAEQEKIAAEPAASNRAKAVEAQPPPNLHKTEASTQAQPGHFQHAGKTIREPSESLEETAVVTGAPNREPNAPYPQSARAETPDPVQVAALLARVEQLRDAAMRQRQAASDRSVRQEGRREDGREASAIVIPPPFTEAASAQPTPHGAEASPASMSADYLDKSAWLARRTLPGDSAGQRRTQPEPSSQPEPLQVNIGSIIVRMEPEPAPAPRLEHPAPAAPSQPAFASNRWMRSYLDR